MQVQEKFSLKNYNTFGIDVSAKFFAVFTSVDELSTLTTHYSQFPALILGGGSNILFTKNFAGIVVKNEIKGIKILHEDKNHVYIKAGAGENWNDFVQHCVSNNFVGVENLSLIPGSVGASPIQNIGAYGVELKNVFHSLEAFHLTEKKIYTFTLNDCEFGYRESVFKKKYKDQFVILDVTFVLDKNPQFNISYGAIKQELEKMNVIQLNLKAISQAVINIRSSKLPDPKVTGNAGSFFKNPEITEDELHRLKRMYPDIISYDLPNGNAKLAAAWLIEQCGWKGYRKNDAGCSPMQALVLVNYGNANGEEIYEISEEIKQSVMEKFNVELKREVNII